MSLVKYYSPKRRHKVIRRNFDDLINNVCRMPVNIEEDEDTYTITAELPGFKPEEIDIEMTRDELIINAEHPDEKTQKEIEDEDTEEIVETTETSESNFIHREIRKNNYRRKIAFGKPINREEAKSSLEYGILKITLPKAEEAKPVKLIPETN